MKLPCALAVGFLLTAPLVAQEPQPSRAASPVESTAQHPAGPRLVPPYQSYEPTIGQLERTAAAAADRVTITITTLGLILLLVLLVVLIA